MITVCKFACLEISEKQSVLRKRDKHIEIIIPCAFGIVMQNPSSMQNQSLTEVVYAIK